MNVVSALVLVILVAVAVGVVVVLVVKVVLAVVVVIVIVLTKGRGCQRLAESSRIERATIAWRRAIAKIRNQGRLSETGRLNGQQTMQLEPKRLRKTTTKSHPSSS